MTSGIYKLVFKNTDKCYIGQSKHLETRLSSHINNIKSGKGAKKLSQAFRDYGTPTLEIIMECGIEELNDAENESIEVYDSVSNGFNTNQYAEQIPSPDNSGELNGMSILSNTKIIDIFKYIYGNKEKRLSIISKELNLPIYTISSIVIGKNHTWLKDIFPEEYAEVMAIKNKRPNGKSSNERGILHPTIISPEGLDFTVSNIRQFALEHGLDRGCLNRLLHSKALSHKGWKLK